MTPVGLDLHRLEPFLLDHVPGFERPARASAVFGGRSNLTYRIHGARDDISWALRRPPLGDVAPTANDIGREYRVLLALQGHGVPTPETVAWCADDEVVGAPFAVSTWVDGDVVRSASDAARLSAEGAAGCATAMVDALVGLHAVDTSSPSVAGLGHPDGFAARQVRRWEQQWDHVKTREVPAFDRLHRLLSRDMPSTESRSVVHGDYRIDNLILVEGDATRIAAIVDWEMATLGDPLTDLALLLAYWEPVCAPLLPNGHPISANAGFPPGDVLARRYVERSGRALDDFAFYRALSFLKLAAIAEGIHGRYLRGQTVGDGFDTVGEAVEPLLERGLELVRSEVWW